MGCKRCAGDDLTCGLFAPCLTCGPQMVPDSKLCLLPRLVTIGLPRWPSPPPASVNSACAAWRFPEATGQCWPWLDISVDQRGLLGPVRADGGGCGLFQVGKLKRQHISVTNIIAMVLLFSGEKFALCIKCCDHVLLQEATTSARI